MFKSSRWRYGWLACLLIAGCGGGSSDSSNQLIVTPAAPSIVNGSTTTSSIASTQVGTTYNLFIYLPPGYAASTSKTYPVIYGLDGDYRFQAMAGYVDHNQIDAILIGIGRADRRQIDYGSPGATAYFNFLTLELIPFVESQYRIDSSNRTITGHSFAGLFVGLSLFMDRLNATHYFKNFIAQDPTFYWQLTYLTTLEQQTFDASNGSLPVTLILSGAACCYDQDATFLFDRLNGRRYTNLNLTKLPVYTASHEDMFNPSFDASLRLIFK